MLFLELSQWPQIFVWECVGFEWWWASNGLIPVVNLGVLFRMYTAASIMSGQMPLKHQVKWTILRSHECTLRPVEGSFPIISTYLRLRITVSTYAMRLANFIYRGWIWISGFQLRVVDADRWGTTGVDAAEVIVDGKDAWMMLYV